MTERPATTWWAILLTVLLWHGAEPALADRLDVSSEAADAADVLTAPELGSGLRKSQRKDDAWQQHELYVDGAVGPRLDGQLLDPILDGLDLTDAALAPTFWEKVEAWLAERMSEESGPLLPDWLRGVRIPDQVSLWIFYISCTLVVLLAIGIIANEVRHARGRRRQSQASAAGTTGSLPAAATDAEPVALLELPGWLLGRLTGLLGLSLRGTRGGSLTHRELVEACGNLTAEVSQPLTALARTAERIRYGDGTPDQADVSAAVEEGRALLQKLETSS